jgi:hypothetical protein
MFLLYGILFLDNFLEPDHHLTQLQKRLLCGIGFLSIFFGGAEVGFFCSVFLVPTTILIIVLGICASILLSHFAVLLGESFLGNLACRLGTRPLVRGCTGEFPARKSKKTIFGYMYATKIG